MSKRLDILMVERSLATAREKAKELIKNGQVSVNDKICNKPSAEVDETADIKISGEVLRYVSRGGLKLEKAILNFNIDIKNKICADIGASTGGFTDCMLQNNALKVFAVDVGHSQLHKSLAENEKVVNLEGVNVRNLSFDDIDCKVDFISVDVSFISLKLVLSVLNKFLSDNTGEMICLIKPQFEAGKKAVGKKGVVKSDKIHKEVIASVIEAVKGNGYSVKGLTFSPVKGPEGNIEYLLYLSHGINRSIDIDINTIVREAFKSFSK